MTVATTQQSPLQLTAAAVRVLVADASSRIGGFGAVGSVMSGAAATVWTMHFTQRCSKDYRASDG
ncbi:MAG: hypothetical protein AB8B93_13165 [Pseudomonadales bacterium]